ncbi:MAG TPA: hypothetical protein PLH94_08710 [Fimbriimonadaceae bacterium]|nr:hypothetical protein [Fimbriimonadaceae bacterium]
MPRPLKWILWVVGTFVSLAIGTVLLMTWGIYMLAGEPSEDEVARVVSPSGKIDAVLFEINGGATTSFGYEIYVVEHGAKPSGSPAVALYGAVRNEHAYGANLIWLSPDSLSVEYLRAKSAKVHAHTQSIGSQTIHIALREGAIDNAAPPGGMLYNLRGRQ